MFVEHLRDCLKFKKSFCIYCFVICFFEDDPLNPPSKGDLKRGYKIGLPELSRRSNDKSPFEGDLGGLIKNEYTFIFHF